MRGCYRFHDMMLHTLLQYVDTETTVILVSDHGYECGRRRPPVEAGKANPEGCHRPFGIVCLKGPGIKKNERLYGASILDVTPTILTLLGLPVGSDMAGRPWVEAFEQPVKPERIFSWEGVGDDQAGLHTENSRQDPAEAAQAVQQLVELGYIAAPGEDVQQKHPEHHPLQQDQSGPFVAGNAAGGQGGSLAPGTHRRERRKSLVRFDAGPLSNPARQAGGGAEDA